MKPTWNDPASPGGPQNGGAIDFEPANGCAAKANFRDCTGSEGAYTRALTLRSLDRHPTSAAKTPAGPIRHGSGDVDQSICRLLTLVALLGLAAPIVHAAAQNLTASRIGQRIDVTVGGDFFTSYRFAPDEKYPFFFPVNGPSGASVTSMRNGKYPHHSSIFFGCDRVNGGNYWQDTHETGQILSEGPVILQAQGPAIVITDTCVWRRPGAEPPFRDTRRITISAPSPLVRQIDVEFTLEALLDVVIGKTNHSLFSVRMDPDLTPAMGGTLVSADGKSGEKDTFGLTAPWLVCFGRRQGGGEIEGVALLQHPANRWGQAPWFTRDYGFMSPTPLYWPADDKETRIAKSEKVVLRYRVLVFAGESARTALPAFYAAWAATP
jgi:hypothetical protein